MDQSSNKVKNEKMSSKEDVKLPPISPRTARGGGGVGKAPFEDCEVTSSTTLGSGKYRRTVRRHVRRPSREVSQHSHSEGLLSLPEELQAVVLEGDHSKPHGNSYRTFDRATGTIVVHPPPPNPVIVVHQIYERLWANPEEVDSAEMCVVSLSMADQVALATEFLKRRATMTLRKSQQKGVMDDEQLKLRMEVALNADRREMLSHFGFDTEELSIIRVHNAATDSILYRKAEELAKLEAEKFQSNVISDNVSPVELLVMQLDAYRYRNVPLPSRKAFQHRASICVPFADVPATPATANGKRRVGVHSIVQRQLAALHK